MSRTFKDRVAYLKKLEIAQKTQPPQPTFRKHYLSFKKNGPADGYDRCPECGVLTDFQNGFIHCSECGWLDCEIVSVLHFILGRAA